MKFLYFILRIGKRCTSFLGIVLENVDFGKKRKVEI